MAVHDPKRIDLLIIEHDFTFLAWNDRYSKGVWVVCAPNAYQANEILESSEDGDLDMIPCTEFVLSTDWLPVEIGPSLADAMTALETRLAKLPADQLGRGSGWYAAVWDALEHLRGVRRESAGYGGTEGRLHPLPSNFTDVRNPDMFVPGKDKGGEAS
ncbi:hypothetical protein [Acidithiobacillus sp.]|uniref:hypothetical protein n=1 Tax=Acidithiobacillus sp. TaxID=1872118 RepID=UPI0031FEE304